MEENIDLMAINLIKEGGAAREEGVSILYKRYYRILSYLFINGTRIEADADELIQETFIKIVKSCQTFKGEASVSTWIRKIAKNCMIDHIRRRPNQVELDEEGWYGDNYSDENTLEGDYRALWLIKNQPSIPSEVSETIEECVKRAFARFANESQENQERARTLELVVEGYEIKKIATFINRTEGATREYLSQCRKKIKEFMVPCRDLLKE